MRVLQCRWCLALQIRNPYPWLEGHWTSNSQGDTGTMVLVQIHANLDWIPGLMAAGEKSDHSRTEYLDGWLLLKIPSYSYWKPRSMLHQNEWKVALTCGSKLKKWDGVWIFESVLSRFRSHSWQWNDITVGVRPYYSRASERMEDSICKILCSCALVLIQMASIVVI